MAMRRRLLTAAICLLLFSAFWWVFSHSSIEVKVENQPGGKFTYLLTNQATQKTVTKQAATPLKLRVAKGQYSVTVKYNDTSYFAVVTTSSWLRKTTVGATLSPEKSRQFVGNSPGACMFYVDQVLLSGNCADLYSQLSEHVPGNNRLPTYKRSVPTITDGVAEGVVSVGQQTIVVLRAANGSGHVGYVLANNFSLANGVLLPDLDNGKTYTVQSFKTGFVAYDDPLGQILYYPTLNAKPSEISIPKPKDKSLLPTALRISGDQIMLAYSNASGEVAASGLDKEVAKPPTPQKGYGKRPVWQWVVLYVVVAGLIYAAVWYLFIRGSGGGY